MQKLCHDLTSILVLDCFESHLALAAQVRTIAQPEETNEFDVLSAWQRLSLLQVVSEVSSCSELGVSNPRFRELLGQRSDVTLGQQLGNAIFDLGGGQVGGDQRMTDMDQRVVLVKLCEGNCLREGLPQPSVFPMVLANSSCSWISGAPTPPLNFSTII